MATSATLDVSAVDDRQPLMTGQQTLLMNVGSSGSNTASGCSRRSAASTPTASRTSDNAPSRASQPTSSSASPTTRRPTSSSSATGGSARSREAYWAPSLATSPGTATCEVLIVQTTRVQDASDGKNA